MTPSTEVKFSVIVPLKRINEYLRECLQHLQLQSYRNFDVFVVTDEPEEIDVPGLAVYFLSSGPVPPNRKRMMAAQRSDADVVALIDDDAYPVKEWLASAAAHFVDVGIVAVGGPGVTPPGDSLQQQASGAVYASPLVSAGYVYRYLPQQPRDVDDYPSCNLMVRREPFLRHVGACLQYWPGEDTKLCLLLTEADAARIVYEPRAVVYHHRRRLFWGHFKQVWNYAVHRGFFAKKYPKTSLRPQYFVPSVFLLANVLVGPLMAFPAARVPTLVVAGVYGLAAIVAAIGSRTSHRANPSFVALGIYLTHLTYGAGFLLGFARPRLEH